MSLNLRKIQGWLIRQPRPVAVSVQAPDRGIETLAIGNPPKWMELAETIVALDATLIHALDANGAIIRALRTDDDEYLSLDDEPQRPQINTAISGNIDGETQRFNLFAAHISDAYRFATQIAFEKMVDLFAAVNRRSESLERSLEATHRLLGKAYQEQVETALEQAQQASSSDPGIGQLLTSFMSGVNQQTIETAAESKGKTK